MNASSAEVSSVAEDWTQLRKNTGVSLEEISAQTHIPVRKLEALERHEFDKLGTTTFVSGYIRRYAKIINQDPQALIQVYLETLPAESAVAANETQSIMAVKPGSHSIWKKVGLVPLVIVTLVVWFGVMETMKDRSSDGDQQTSSQSQGAQSGNAEDSSDSGAPSSELTPVQSSDTLASEEYPETSTDTDSPGNQELQTQVPTPTPLSASALSTSSLAGTSAAATAEVILQATPIPAPVQQNAATSATQAASQQQINTTNDNSSLGAEETLVFTFSEDCWVNVKDATGRVLIAQLKRKGDNLQLFGQAPFNILLGNARAVTLTLNGREVSTTPPGNKKTYRFNVNG